MARTPDYKSNVDPQWQKKQKQKQKSNLMKTNGNQKDSHIDKPLHSSQ